MTGSILHLMFHALMKGGLFLCAGIFIYRLGSNDFTQLAGIGRRMPWTSAAVVLGGLGMIGVPGTAGFISKLHLLRGLLLADHPILAMLVLLGSAMAAIYTWKFVEIAYLKPAAEDAEEIREAPFEMLWPVWLLIGSSIWLGLNPAPVVELATDAARALLGGGG
jgi:multicomponent Na+:H+ antiporter subunit D